MRGRVWKKYMPILMDPQHDSLPVTQKSKLAGISYNSALALEANDDFMKFVRDKRMKMRSQHLMKVDEVLLDVAENSDNDAARVSASRELMKRWDSEYEDKTKLDVQVTFTQLMQNAYGNR
jgi:hypothetical protein